MRYNDREMLKLSENKGDLEGVLHHMKPQGSDWSDWYQQNSFKERYFKLISNMLFYYRTNDTSEPLGVLVLENAQVAYERPHKGISFAFSVTFKVNDRNRDNESKHVFSCRCELDVNRWVSALKMASYEYWRSQYYILKTKISMKTGKDPVLDYMRNKASEHHQTLTEMKKTKRKPKPATFFSHVESLEQSSYTSSSNFKEVENLIDL